MLKLKDLADSDGRSGGWPFIINTWEQWHMSLSSTRQDCFAIKVRLFRSDVVAVLSSVQFGSPMLGSSRWWMAVDIKVAGGDKKHTRFGSPKFIMKAKTKWNMMFLFKESAFQGTCFQLLVFFFLGGGLGVWIASFEVLHLKDHCAAVRATQSPGALG